MATCRHEGCKASALREGDGRCFFHSEIPAIVAKRNVGRIKGGKAVRQTPAPKTLAELTKLIGVLLAKAVDGHKPDAATSNLCQVALRAFELSELEQRMKKLESR